MSLLPSALQQTGGLSVCSHILLLHDINALCTEADEYFSVCLVSHVTAACHCCPLPSEQGGSSVFVCFAWFCLLPSYSDSRICCTHPLLSLVNLALYYDMSPALASRHRQQLDTAELDNMTFICAMLRIRSYLTQRATVTGIFVITP